MIRKYVFGNPVETEAVVMQLPVSRMEENDLIEMQYDGEQLRMACPMGELDQVFGLGEQVRGINKRGFSYVSYAADDPNHTENRHSLYGAHNFMILDGAKRFGVFVDDPSRVVFDAGETDYDRLEITAGPDCVVYLIEGDSLKDIVKQFRTLIGRSYVAPKWAFGYQQSRWGYRCEDDIRDVVKNHHGNGIPLDAVYLDIDYMDDYKDFTVSASGFPDFGGFVREMQQEHVHLVPIIDAGVKIEEGYSVYEEGVAGDYFCKDEDGENFVAAVWPGRVHFPDVLNADARKWFGDKYKVLIDQGIDGFWNDMNEPAIFYSDKRLQEAFDKIDSMKHENLNIHSFFHLKDALLSLSNSIEDYRSFYHNMDGRRVCHDKVHNIFGYNMTRAAAEAFERIAPQKRILMFSRSSYIGMHRYGGIWTGDNQSWWQQLLLSIQQMPSLGMCGFLYTGSDIGGFGSDVTEDLLLRWTEFGIFTPLMRNHSAIGTRDQEVYRFASRLQSFRNLIRIRYGLIPYLYSEYMKAVLDNELYFRPLAFDYLEDPQARRVEDQLMLGDSLMLAPVYTQNALGRYVYLPEDMLMIRMKSLEDRTYTEMKKGHHYIDVALDEVVVFLRRNRVLPLAVLSDEVLSTADLEGAKLEWIGYVPEQASYVLYADDGLSKEYPDKETWRKAAFSKDDFAKGSCIATADLERY